MKYGRHDYEWNKDCAQWDNFCKAVTDFNVECFQPFMKRKTLDEKDRAMLKALTEMVEIMNNRAKEVDA